MDNVALGIVIIIAGLIVLTIILKLCTKFVYLRYFLMVAPLLQRWQYPSQCPNRTVRLI